MLIPLVKQRRYNHLYYLMTFRHEKIAKAYLPGQFVMIHPAGKFTDPLLRRPFSLWSCDTKTGTFEVLYQVVGRGTEMMSSLRDGEEVEIDGPYGRPFHIPKDAEEIILVGGGVGVPPLLTVADSVATRKTPPRRLSLFIGGRGKDNILVRPLPRNLRRYITTEDGSEGMKGLITDRLRMYLEEHVPYQHRHILTCGPNPMMHAVAKVAAEFDLPCQVSLENRMACAVGVCLGCVVKPNEGYFMKDYVRVCTEGPVFDARAIAWEELP